MDVNIIFSSDLKEGIGYNNQINFIKEDMNYFRNMTAGSIVVFGSNTFRSFKPAGVPLPGRINLLLTTRHYKETDNFYYSDEKNFLNKLKSIIDIYKKPVFVIGGSKTFSYIYSLPIHIKIRNIYHTRIHEIFKSDTYFKADVTGMNLVSEIGIVVIKNRKKIKLTFLHYSDFCL